MALTRQRLAERRKTLGYSQESLAERMSVDRSTVARWERGECEPQPFVRLKLAQVLQVTPLELDGLLAHRVSPQAERCLHRLLRFRWYPSLMRTWMSLMT